MSSKYATTTYTRLMTSLDQNVSIPFCEKFWKLFLSIFLSQNVSMPPNPKIPYGKKPVNTPMLYTTTDLKQQNAIGVTACDKRDIISRSGESNYETK